MRLERDKTREKWQNASWACPFSHLDRSLERDLPAEWQGGWAAVSLPRHPRALGVFPVVRAPWAFRRASHTGDLGARMRCVRCRAWMCSLCALHGTRVEWGGWEWATVRGEDSWCPKWWAGWASVTEMVTACVHWVIIPGWHPAKCFFRFHLNESLNNCWHRRCTINWRWANWGSERSSLAQDHTARKWWSWVGIGSKASPVSHKILNPWAPAMEENKQPDDPWRPGPQSPLLLLGSLPSAQLWHLLGVSAHSAFEFGAWRILLVFQTMLK